MHYVRCHTFTVKDTGPVTIPMQSIDGFMACDGCYTLVQLNNREALYYRIMHVLTENNDIVWTPETETQLRSFLDQFWKNLFLPTG